MALSALLLTAALVSLALAPAFTRAQSRERVVTLTGGVSLTVPVAWNERRSAIPPPALLQTSAPDFRFSDFVALENSAAPAALRVGVSSNPFLGLDPRALDTRLSPPEALAAHLLFFFFPPPDACLAEAAAAFRREQARKEAEQLEKIKNEKDDDRRTSLSSSPPSVSITQHCAFSSSLADFYSAQLSAGVAVRRGSGGLERASGLLSSFRIPPMEQVEVNGMTFFVFEAQGQHFVEQNEVDKFRLPQAMRGARAHFFWAVGAPSPFPFTDDAMRQDVPLVHIAYTTLSLSGEARAEFLSLLRALGTAMPAN